MLRYITYALSTVLNLLSELLIGSSELLILFLLRIIYYIRLTIRFVGTNRILLYIILYSSSGKYARIGFVKKYRHP